MPVLAVASALRTLHPDAVLHALCPSDPATGRAGSDRPDNQEVLRRAGIPFTVLPVLRLRWDLPLRFFCNVRISSRMLRSFRPDVVFSKGGALGVPACFLAHRRKIPVILHESDAVMGRANRFAIRFATTLCLGSSATLKDLGQRTGYLGGTDDSSVRSPKSQVLYTGNPIRPEILRGSREEGLRITGFSGDRPILLVLGGSQGAAALNEALRMNLPPLLTLCDVAHLTGQGKEGAPPQRGYWSRPFATDELPHLYACASMALSRAGAGAISELAALGLPSILVPLTGLAQDHQTANALQAEQTGGCILLQQEMLSRRLVPLLADLAQNPQKRAQMGAALRSAAAPDASRRIAKIIVESIERRGEDA